RQPLFMCAFPHPAPSEIYTLSLHDALPICADAGSEIGLAVDLLHVLPGRQRRLNELGVAAARLRDGVRRLGPPLEFGGRHDDLRSEEHTSELQSQSNLVCRLLLEKKNN